jgi:Flp pilus assembly protein TadD
MRIRFARFVLVSACLIGLAGCETTKNAEVASSADPTAEAADDEVETGSIGDSSRGANPVLLGQNAYDDLSVGKKYYRAAQYGNAEKHFRRAVEKNAKDAEAWLGLAASYDRLKRFDLADRAYEQVVKLIGPTAEILNNQGYSYILRGDHHRARAKLLEAQSKDPTNPYVKNNLDLLDESFAKAKSVQ